MRKKLVTFIVLCMAVFGLAACGSEDTESDNAGAEDTQAEDTQAEETQEEEAADEGKDTFKIGETWTVEDEWELTVDGVTVTDERNEFEESDPAQVIIVDYHYENIGYEDEDELMDGLYLDFYSAIDSDGNMCTTYPADITYPMETPVGAKCTAQCAFGLMEEGSPVKLLISQYNGAGTKSYSATFELEF